MDLILRAGIAHGGADTSGGHCQYGPGSSACDMPLFPATEGMREDLRSGLQSPD